MKTGVPRRTFCKVAGMTAAAGWLGAEAAEAAPLSMLKGAAIAMDGRELSDAEVRLEMRWSGDTCRPIVRNTGVKPVALREVRLFTWEHELPAETWVYGEAFQMLTQTVGTLGSLREIGMGEQAHYRIPGPKDAAVITSLLTLSPPGRPHMMLAYTSCHRFIGRFYVRQKTIEAVVDTEGLTLEPGQSFDLEGMAVMTGLRRETLLSALAQMLNRSHPHTTFRPVPTGWCSWYCFARQVTAKNVIANLDEIQKKLPSLKYIQIDDGYQRAMGDWFEPGRGFEGGVKEVLREIKSRGLEPAIWVAPFIAEGKSTVLREHPEWFVKDATGKPMPAATVSFTGWGGGDWYSLDGTNPEVQRHFEDIFRRMREEWGCSYFKLDANFWGAIHGGYFHDPKATRIEAYRRGMEAVRRGAKDSFLLGCNHPIWPSLGLVDGSRSSGDISRRWTSVSKCMEETMYRNWQNGTLWWNDPDAVVLQDRPDAPMKGVLTAEELRFHATAVFASGGMVLSGDDLTTIPEERLSMLRKLLPPTGAAAVFDDASTLEVGRVRLKDGERVCVFNRSEAAKKIEVPLKRKASLEEIWSGESLGTHERKFIAEVSAHGGLLLKLKEA
ncbi:MAG: alpha-galactosidase [Acidobacteria bacterium]|nr:alpha-galactosidase [Acidobacteriota bacterium]